MKSTRPKSADIIPLAQEATQTRETDNPFRKTGYARSSQNALKHGILSRYTVLPHEDGAEYQALLAALVEEHNPQAQRKCTWWRNWRASSGASSACAWPRARRSIKACEAYYAI